MPKETPKMAGTMMKTKSRVKRTVREMPNRLTTKLSKGSSRNMMKGEEGRLGHAKAGALQIPEVGRSCPGQSVNQSVRSPVNQQQL